MKDLPSRLKSLLKEPWFAYTFALCSAVLFYLLCVHIPDLWSAFRFLFGILNSVIIGIVLAYLINPLVNLFETKVFTTIKRKHSVSVFCALLVFLFIITLALVLLIPSLTNSVNSLFSNMNGYMKTLQDLISQIEETANARGIDLTLVGDKLSDIITEIVNSLPDYITKVLQKSFQVGSGMMNWGIGLIFAIYFLSGKEQILNALDKLRRVLFSEKTYQRNTAFFAKCDNILTQYIWYSLLDALIIGSANAIFMTTFRMPYIALISIVVGVTNLLPTFGPIIGAVIGGFILILHKPSMAIAFFVFTMVLQTIDGYVIKPKLFSGSLGVPSVLILIAVIIGGKLFGVIGILLAIPCAAILTFLYTDILFPMLERRKAQRTSN